MFDIGLQEMLVIGVLALLVFGPSKLPELGRMVGRTMREFRRASDEFRTTVETNLNFNDIDPPPAPTQAASSPGTMTTLPSEMGASADREAFGTGDATATAVMAAATVDEHSEPFCAQRSGRIFHRSDCGWVRRIPDIERVYMKRLADAVDQGYVKCPVCEPWEPV
jgi:Tat protein translocase TatB subunit